MTALERLAGYIGRETEKALLLTYSERILTQARCLALYIQGEGGLGKTHLLALHPSILEQAGSSVVMQLAQIRIAQVIDLYHFESRSPHVIEQRLIEGLKQTDDRHWYRLDANEVAEAFYEHTEAYNAYYRAQETQAEEERLRGS